jgi:branched-chain amino acid transport system substrate-binding protein
MVIEESFLTKETNFVTYLKAIRATRPDMVYAPIYSTSMVPIARQAKAAGLSGSIFMGGDGWDTTTLLDAAGAELLGATFTSHFAIDAPGDQTRAFVTAYRQRFQHDPSSLGALGYDAAEMLADAIKRASGDTPSAIRDAIQATKDFRGVTGKISIDADRNAVKGVIVVRIEKRRFVYHATAD